MSGAAGLEAADMSSQFAIKAALRKDMLRKLRQISPEQLEAQSTAVFNLVRQQPFYQNASNVACYLSMQKGELQTTRVVHDLLSRDKKLYTPYLPPAASVRQSKETTTTNTPRVDGQEPGSENPLMEMLRLYTTADLESCVTDKWGILDPGLTRLDMTETRRNVMDDSVEDLDLILLPGVAFDEECNRLGRGKAYYDRFLHRYTSTRKHPLLVALALSEQLLPPGERVPTTPNDFQLDAVISPEGLVWRKGRNS